MPAWGSPVSDPPLLRVDLPGARVAFTTRAGGVSAPPYDSLNLGLHVGDDPAAVVENRRRAAAALGATLDDLAVAEQVHGDRVATVGAGERGRGARSVADAIPATDALICAEPGVVVAIMVADCVPVAVVDPQAGALGVAHAGWGGTVAHVAGRTVAALADRLGAEPARMHAVLGPSIGPDSYEVGEDVADRAAAAFPDVEVVRPGARPGKYLLDLWAANAADLAAAGVPAANVTVVGADTLADDRFFSHRRSAPTGRFAVLATLAA